MDEARVIPLRGSSQSARRPARRAGTGRVGIGRAVDGDAAVYQLEPAADLVPVDPVPPVVEPRGW
ncbi:MAG: hypothetical protein ABI301_01565, partial [Jatrophihabitantaceae bacterium]